MLVSDDTIIRFQLDQYPRTHQQEAGINAAILLTRPTRRSIRDRLLLRTGNLLVEAGTYLKCRAAARSAECTSLIESRVRA